MSDDTIYVPISAETQKVLRAVFYKDAADDQEAFIERMIAFFRADDLADNIKDYYLDEIAFHCLRNDFEHQVLEMAKRADQAHDDEEDRAMMLVKLIMKKYVN